LWFLWFDNFNLKFLNWLSDLCYLGFWFFDKFLISDFNFKFNNRLRDAYSFWLIVIA
jgi:hypothetical protein